MTWTLTLWAILIGGPLLGITAVCALAVLHEHGKARTQLAARTTRRSSTALLEDYLLDEQTASLAMRRKRQSQLIAQTARASSWVFDEYVSERLVPGVGAAAAVSAHRVPTGGRRAPVRPALVAPARAAFTPAPRVPAPVAARPSLRRPERPAALGTGALRPAALAFASSPRSTRLVPLSPEIAIS